MKDLIKKISSIWVIAFLIFIYFIPPAIAQYRVAPKYLLELGKQFYLRGQYKAALEEFEKALLINPDLEEAQEYIDKIKKRERIIAGTLEKFESREEIPSERFFYKLVKAPSKREILIRKTLDRWMAKMGKKFKKKKVTVVVPEIVLNEAIKATQPNTKLQIEKGKSIVIRGKQITHWLVISPNIIAVERKNSDEIIVKGQEIGVTFFHLWDISGRWTFNVLCTLPKPTGPTLEEELRLAEERAKTFKLRYNFGWNLYEKGKRLDNLERESYAYSHALRLEGPTPYGNFDATCDVRSLKETTDLTYVSVNLTKGRIGPFEDFTLRAFDYTPGFSNLSFEPATLRGVMLNSPAFNKKLDYTIFWGREGGGRYGGLSPGLAKIKDSFLAGLNLNYYPSSKADYEFTITRGWGRAREDYLNEYNYNLETRRRFEHLDLEYTLSYDSETFANLLGLIYHTPDLSWTAELRNINKDFVSSTGYGWRRGEIGGLFTLKISPQKNINISSRLDIFRDRLFPSPENKNRWNVNFDLDTIFSLSSSASLRFDYSLYNELGRISQYRFHGLGVGLSKRWDWIRKINTFINYRHQESKHFNAPRLDYINDKISFGLRFNLIDNLYYYINKEINWLEERYNGVGTRPNALETGFDWHGKILNTPLSGSFRLTYRDEEDTLSSLSFLSGEDYIEVNGELSYSPQPDTEFYLSGRLRNVWADNPNVEKRVEFDVYAGVRYLWDTGFRWEPKGGICGYVFEDLNFDGIRQENEKGIEGAKVWLGKKKFKITDKKGFYKFSNIRAKKVYVSIDTTTLPAGFLLTVPAAQEVEIIHRKEIKLNFGIASYSEIYGYIFEDVDMDGKFTEVDRGIKDVILTLEDGTQAITDEQGRYYFKKASPGEHTIRLNLGSLPLKFLPQVPIVKKITLFKGTSFVYNIPVRSVQ